MRIKITFVIFYFVSFSAYAAESVSIDIFSLLGDDASFISLAKGNARGLAKGNAREIVYNVKLWDVNSEIANTMAAALKGLDNNVKINSAGEIGPALRKVFATETDIDKLEGSFEKYNKSLANFVVYILPLTLNHPAPGIVFKGYGSNGNETMGIIDLFLIAKVFIFDAKTNKLVEKILSPNYMEFTDTERNNTLPEVNTILQEIQAGSGRDPDLKKYRAILTEENLTIEKKLKEINSLYAKEFSDITADADGDTDYGGGLDLVKLNTLLRPIHHTSLSYPKLSPREKNKIDKQMENLQKRFVGRIISKIKDNASLANAGFQ